jgi:hypothetical protein
MGLAERLPDEATYVPDESDKVQLGKVYDFLAAHEQAGQGEIELRYFLSGAEAEDRVELPRHVYEVLHQVVEDGAADLKDARKARSGSRARRR